MDKATKRKFIKRTEQEKLNLIDQWEKSGLPIKTFSEQHHFSDSIFHSWLNKYRRNSKAVNVQKAFVPIEVTAASPVEESSSSLYVEVVTAKGSEVRIYQPVSVDFLRKLLF